MRWIVFLVFLMGDKSAPAQTRENVGSISGVVVDESGAGIEGARITVSNENGAALSATTTADGHFSIASLPFGRYRVSVESASFEGAQTSAEVSEASPAPSLELRLRVQGLSQEVTVTAATRSDANIEDLPISATVVTRQEIINSPAQSLDQLLLAIPGVNLQEPPSFAQHPTSNAVSMRGLGGYRTLVLLDGVPLNDAFFGYVQWNQVPLESIDHVEVVRGGASSLWGNYAMSGVINIVTKAPVKNNLSMVASYGSYTPIKSAVRATSSRTAG